MGRKFKRKPVQRTSKAKNEPVLSVGIIGKEYIEKINGFRKKLTSWIKGFKIKNYVTR